jgi:hypothetical protein
MKESDTQVAAQLAAITAAQTASEPATALVPENALALENGRVAHPLEILTPDKQVIVIALLSLGFSRRTAARHVGCTHTTIARAAERHPHFAFQIADAEMRADFGALKQVREASKQDKYWRAAAWFLERRLPDEFGRRPAHSFSGDQVMAILAEVFSYTIAVLPESEKECYLRAFGNTLRDVEKSVESADRWRQLAEDDTRTGKALRSPYEHPAWREAAEIKALPEGQTNRAEPYQPAVAVPEELLRTVATPPLNPFTPPGFRPCVEQQLIAAAGEEGAKVCQSSQRWEKKQLRALRRKSLPANGLEQSLEPVPEADKSHRGEENGHCPVHLSNGHS